MRLRLGINWVDYRDVPCSKRQARAVEQLLVHKPSWCDVYALLLPQEHPNKVPGIIRHLPRSFMSGGRTLPYLKDILNSLLDVVGEHDKIGFMNSDILVDDRFFNAIWGHWVNQAFTCHRVDLENYEQDPAKGWRLSDQSTDILIVDKDAWIQYESRMPDYILGEPGWGYGSRIWIDACKLLCKDLDHGECTHIKHVGKWCLGVTRGRVHNQSLYRDQWRTNKLTSSD